MNKEQKKQISDLLDGLGEGLDITPLQHKDAVDSYQAVGDWLAREGSSLAPFKPEILPQGSFLLGTMIKPVNPKDDLDIDLVCRLSGIQNGWTAYHLKQAVGIRLNAHGTYKELLQHPDGRRCWTLKYAPERGFHMDILPSLVGRDFFFLMEKSMSDQDLSNAQAMAIRITDKYYHNYRTSTNPLEWPSSNMFGYGAWFKFRSQVTTLRKAITLNEAIQPVPDYQRRKLPLQRIVQILKRHRDIMFNGDEDKPISIIITTLAAHAYNGSDDLLSALIHVVNTMENYVRREYDMVLGIHYWSILNPVNPAENFADKWPANPQKEKNFWRWIAQVKEDIRVISLQESMGGLRATLEKPFGPDLVKSVFTNIGHSARTQRENGGLFMSGVTGMLGASGRTEVPNHNFFGNNE